MSLMGLGRVKRRGGTALWEKAVMGIRVDCFSARRRGEEEQSTSPEARGL
jgi:hypothetical protein